MESIPIPDESTLKKSFLDTIVSVGVLGFIVGAVVNSIFGVMEGIFLVDGAICLINACGSFLKLFIFWISMSFVFFKVVWYANICFEHLIPPGKESFWYFMKIVLRLWCISVFLTAVFLFIRKSWSNIGYGIVWGGLLTMFLFYAGKISMYLIRS
jgi:hypothetical protein